MKYTLPFLYKCLMQVDLNLEWKTESKPKPNRDVVLPLLPHNLCKSDRTIKRLVELMALNSIDM
jgi:hypothetical protein